MKLFLSGPSGVGKTTLAKEVSKIYGIPFVSMSAKDIWPKYGINTHQEMIDMCTHNPEVGIQMQFELLEVRKELMAKYPEFVSDRSPLDNFVYFMMQNAHHVSEEVCTKYLKACQEGFGDNAALLQIYYSDDIVLEDDGKRVNNTLYQKSVGALFKWAEDYFVETECLFDTLGKYRASPMIVGKNNKAHYIDTWHFYTRVEEVRKFLNFVYGSKTGKGTLV